MLIKEFRVILPISVDEYQVGQLFAVAEASKNETGGGDGVEVLVNEPYEENGEKGQYTHKRYHLQSKVPDYVRWLTVLSPKSALIIHEKAWNAYPYCRTILTNEYMKNNMMIKIETWHKPDMGEQDNVHGVDPDTWSQTEVVFIDIGDNGQVDPMDLNENADPTTFKSEKTGRGPLGPKWQEELQSPSSGPHMCAYKLVTVYFKWFGLVQGKVESLILKQEQRLFISFHRQLFCWMDRWVDLSMDDIRQMEEETQKELDEMREKEPRKGMGL